MDFFSNKFCQNDDHKIDKDNRRQLTAICQNIYCSQEKRECCLECIKEHMNHDPQSVIEQFMDVQGMQKVFDEIKKKYADKLNVIWTQGQIQYYLNFQQFKDYILRWLYKNHNLREILQKHNDFFSYDWKKLTVEEYLINENINLGIFKYLEKFDYEISKIEELKNQYLRTTISQDELNFQDQRNVMNRPILEILQQTLGLLQIFSQNTFTKITKQSYFKRFSQNDNPHISMWEIILQQGYELQIYNMHKQYKEIWDKTLKNQLKDYQKQYLQAYALHHSDERIDTLNNQLNLINQSIEANNNYAKSHELKKIILQHLKDNEKKIKTENQVGIQISQNNNLIQAKQQIQKQNQDDSKHQHSYMQQKNDLQQSQIESRNFINQENFNKFPYNSSKDTLLRYNNPSISEAEMNVQIFNMPNISESQEKNIQDRIDVCLLIDNTIKMEKQLSFIQSSFREIDRKAKQNIQWSIIPYDQEHNNKSHNFPIQFQNKNVENVIQSLSQIQYHEDFVTYQNIESGLTRALKIDWQCRVKVIIIFNDTPNDKLQQLNSNGVQFYSHKNIENCLKQLIDSKIKIIWLGFQDLSENQIFIQFNQYFKQHCPYYINSYLIQDNNQQEFINYSIKMLQEISQESIIIQ